MYRVPPWTNASFVSPRVWREGGCTVFFCTSFTKSHTVEIYLTLLTSRIGHKQDTAKDSAPCTRQQQRVAKMEKGYFSIGAILAEDDRVPVIFTRQAPGLGFLDPGKEPSSK